MKISKVQEACLRAPLIAAAISVGLALIAGSHVGIPHAFANEPDTEEFDDSLGDEPGGENSEDESSVSPPSSGRAPAPSTRSRACYYAGPTGNQRICEDVAPPRSAYCSTQRSNDCCDETKAVWTAKNSANYRFPDRTRTAETQLVLWECKAKPGVTGVVYRPKHGSDAAKNRTYYSKLNKLGTSPRFKLSALPPGFVTNPEEDPVTPPASGGGTPNDPPTTNPPADARAEAELLKFNPLDPVGAPLTAAERTKLTSAQCGFVDLRDQGLPPVRHQQMTGWTFANAAADLVEFRGKEVVARSAREQGAVGAAASLSPSDLTIRYYRFARAELTRAEFESYRVKPAASPSPVGKDIIGMAEMRRGSVRSILEAFRGQNYQACLEKEVPSEQFASVSCEGASATKMGFRDLVSCLDRMVTRLCNANLQGAALQSAKKEAIQKNEGVLKTLFPGVEFSAIESTLSEAMNQGDPALAFIENLNQKSCKNPVKLPASLADGLQGKSTTEDAKMKELDTQLSAKNPAAVILLRDAFMNPALAATEAPGLSVEQWAEQGQAGLVAGRRWNPADARCEYLIKTNLGPECSAVYTTELVSPARLGTFCQAGYVWVPQAAVKKGIREVAYLKR